jgi:hypothetical protein
MNRLVESPAPVSMRSSVVLTDPSSASMSLFRPESCRADLPIFQQPWWLEIAKANADYREVKVYEDGEVVGRLPFVVVTNMVGNKLGFPPIWSHLGGPVASQDLASEKRVGVLRELIAQLPDNISFKFVCGADARDANLIRQIFQEAGFECSTETTYLQYPRDKGILERLSGESKRQIVSARNNLQVIEISGDEFIAFYEANLTAAGKQSYASLQNARNLIVRGQKGDAPQMRVIAAKQKHKGAPLDAAITYAWDSKRYYLWLTTHRSSSRDHSGDKPHPHAGKVLILEGTEDARQRGLVFDVDGAATEGNQILYRDRLKFPHAESRDVFTRDTRLHKIYKHLRLGLCTMWPSILPAASPR